MKEDAASFLQNKILFGRNPATGIVAVEPAPGDHMRVFRRLDGKLTVDEQPFRPFLWINDAALLAELQAKHQIEKLEGNEVFRYLVSFPSWRDFLSARKYLARITYRTPAESIAPYFLLTDPVQQHLMRTGQTFFKGMRFEELHRLQIDIETDCASGYGFPNPQRESDRILCIALADNRGWEHMIASENEAGMLEELVGVIQERDPDVLEGHNIFKFDLDYIVSRARLRKVRLALGRDGTDISSRPSGIQIAERLINYPKHEIFGRHVVYTFLLVLFYDISSRDLEGFGLKEVARHFGLAAKERTYIEPGNIASVFHTDPQRVKAYALDDVRETRALAELLSPSYFIQAQIFPFAYQDVVVRGNATKIDSLFLREYLAQNHSIPQPEESRPYAGGYTDIFFTGVARNVWHCDIQSLYPSIILSFNILPAKDKLGIFRSLLSDLREFRLKAKIALKSVRTRGEGQHFNSLQTTFKILINSFYGYLGFAQAHFGDFSAAERVTAKGRELLQQMIGWLKTRGAQLIEIDTDGIYFVPPPNASGEELEKELQATLPLGIDVEFDGRFPAMFSYKAKNYALYDEQARLSLTGAALRSRGLEKFQRDFLEEFLLLVLTDRPGEVPALLEQYRQKIRGQEWPIEMLMKTETLQDSLDTYRSKIGGAARNKSAPYELAIKSGRNYQPGDQISFYITGANRKVSAYENCKLSRDWRPNQRDENVDYYLDKLEQLYNKFAPICGLPSQKSTSEDPRQTTLF